MTDRSLYLAKRDETTPDWFPDLGTFSAAPLKRFVPVLDAPPGPPEYIYLKRPAGRPMSAKVLGFNVTVMDWNWLWEAGHLTPAAINSQHVPDQLRWLLKIENRNLRLVTRGRRNRYNAYAPLYHLLPAHVVRTAGLPLLKRGIWPHVPLQMMREDFLPADFDLRLAQAFSQHLWPLLNGRSARFAFTAADPIRVLSHHLDFWLPYIDLVAQRRMRAHGRCELDDDDPTYELDVKRINELNANSGAQVHRPLRGGHLWMGEDEAWEATQELVDVADEHGSLRGIVDAVRSHRIQDDFSSVWSFEREDFERKLYRKRAKVKVVFAEMSDSVPVYSHETEVHERLLWGDFLTLLDKKERRVAVCLRRGSIGVGDIAKELGYANHSPVSKALAKVRQKALVFFDKH